MNLYLLRHGIAVARNDPGGTSDSERELTAKGRERVRRAAKGLARMSISFSILLTSPLVRARQTADIVARVLGLESDLEAISALAPESSVEQLLFSLTQFQHHDHILLVGHEPLLTDTASFLLSGKRAAKLKIQLGKGGLCHIEIHGLPPPAPGSLRSLLTPKQLRQIGSKLPRT